MTSLCSGLALRLLRRGFGCFSALWQFRQTFTTKFHRQMLERRRVLSWRVSYLFYLFVYNSVSFLILQFFPFYFSCYRRDIGLNHTMRSFFKSLVSLQVTLFCTWQYSSHIFLYWLSQKRFAHVQGVDKNLDKNCTKSFSFPDLVQFYY